MSLAVDVVRRVGDFELRARFTTGDGIAVLFGPSGAGKTLTIRLLAGLDRPDRGRIELDGEPLVDTDAGLWVPAQDRRVGIVFQDALLLPHRTVIDNVALAVREPGDRRQVALRWLEEVGADDLSERRPAQLSGGQAQRVALARALAGGPRVVLLDEPFNALDLPVRRRMRTLLMTLVDRWRVPTVFVTHDPEEARELGDRIVPARDGLVGAV
ncbi:MAG: hypothetical protein KatS3mg011_2057 [Acidimicrobiia bacterium]|nr:MAG: hypothetical protein KatS3mg011_2057 [Acidimicrobiia bacterium]